MIEVSPRSWRRHAMRPVRSVDFRPEFRTYSDPTAPMIDLVVKSVAFPVATARIVRQVSACPSLPVSTALACQHSAGRRALAQRRRIAREQEQISGFGRCISPGFFGSSGSPGSDHAGEEGVCRNTLGGPRITEFARQRRIKSGTEYIKRDNRQQSWPVRAA
jgi:hypothetical protein